MARTKLPYTKAQYRHLNELNTLIRMASHQRLNDGDRRRMVELLREFPQEADRYDNLGGQVTRSWIDRIAGQEQVWAAVLELQIEGLRNQLSGPSPELLEKLLVDEVICGWMRVKEAELGVARTGDRPAAGKPGSGAALIQAQQSFHRSIEVLHAYRLGDDSPAPGRRSRSANATVKTTADELLSMALSPKEPATEAHNGASTAV